MSERNRYLDPEASHALLGIGKQVPLTVDKMSANLCVTFFPDTKLDTEQANFAKKLQDAFAAEAQHHIGENGHGANTFFEIDGRSYVRVAFRGVEYVAAAPHVWVLSTRSGCNKFFLNPETDIVRMGLKKGRVIFDTPRGIQSSADCKPSYDTLTILSHAVANALAASILLNFDEESRFVRALNERGLSLTHWHDYPEEVELPAGYVIHGADNPSVSCSTPQSALYALLGKFRAVQTSPEREESYLGDVHIEPHHGTNIIGVLSLAEIAEWHYQNRQKRKRQAFSPIRTST